MYTLFKLFKAEIREHVLFLFIYSESLTNVSFQRPINNHSGGIYGA